MIDSKGLHNNNWLDEAILEDGYDEYHLPYTILMHSSERFTLEVPVAGFDKDDIKVIREDEYLTISGNKPARTLPSTILYEGFPLQSFVKQFKLAGDVTLSRYYIYNGLLAIELRRNLSKKMRKIDLSLYEKDEINVNPTKTSIKI